MPGTVAIDAPDFVSHPGKENWQLWHLVGRCLTASVTESAAAKLVPEMWWQLQKLHCYICPGMCHINTTIFDAFAPWGIIPATLCGLVIVDEVHL